MCACVCVGAYVCVCGGMYVRNCVQEKGYFEDAE